MDVQFAKKDELESHLSKSNANRRRSFRIYDNVDIFYQKIGQQDSLNSDQLQKLPESLSNENATLNVNISSSGISFTCKEVLKPGDIILVRVLLLSSMTVIMCPCRVVYFKPPNTYENNRYPYTIGAEFINLRQEDKDLLDKHIRHKRKWQWFFRLLFLSAFLALIYVPEVIAELLLEQFELLVDLFHEAVFLIDELINYWISYGLSFFYPQSPTTVQTIGFYLQSVIYMLIASWAFFKWIPNLIKTSIFRIRRFFARKKASLGYFWRNLPLINKIAYVFASIAIVILPGMFLV